MINAFIDKKYMVDTYKLTDFEETNKAEYYILRASRKVAQLITNPLFDEDDIAGLTKKQTNAIKEATAIYTDYYWKDDFDFTSGSVSMSVGGNSFSESRQYDGEKVIPQVFELLQNADLLEAEFGTYLIITDNDPENSIFSEPKEFELDDTRLKALEDELELAEKKFDGDLNT